MPENFVPVDITKLIDFDTSLLAFLPSELWEVYQDRHIGDSVVIYRFIDSERITTIQFGTMIVIVEKHANNIAWHATYWI